MTKEAAEKIAQELFDNAWDAYNEDPSDGTSFTSIGNYNIEVEYCRSFHEDIANLTIYDENHHVVKLVNSDASDGNSWAIRNFIDDASNAILELVA